MSSSDASRDLDSTADDNQVDDSSITKSDEMLGHTSTADINEPLKYLELNEALENEMILFGEIVGEGFCTQVSKRPPKICLKLFRTYSHKVIEKEVHIDVALGVGDNGVLISLLADITRSYFDDMADVEHGVSALVFVCFLPGYPETCPRLEIEPQQGLTQANADDLLSLLEEKLNELKGKSMILSLHEAAKEFLSTMISSSRDLALVHILRLACSSSSELAEAFPQIASELHHFGLLTRRALDFSHQPSTVFYQKFDLDLSEQKALSSVPNFWKHPELHSRYSSDFEQIKKLGSGAFGHVKCCKNKVDGRMYAVKRIRLRGDSPLDQVLREVNTLSSLQHPNIVRYFQAWFETGATGRLDDSSDSDDLVSTEETELSTEETELRTYLYIQMEYCPERSLFELLDGRNELLEATHAWAISRQIVAGLKHMHEHGIIHRDIKPANIFFDAERKNVKIGDFGLAKFLEVEQLESGTGGTPNVGTGIYMAPEIVARSKKAKPIYDEKADIYSFGVVFFELWHPFRTMSERAKILSELKETREGPTTWVAEFPKQAQILKLLISENPSDRPCAGVLLGLIDNAATV